MALDMSKYEKVARVKRKLPIIFVINEKMRSSEKWDGGQYKGVIEDIMDNLSYRSIEAVMSVVSFGKEVHLWSEYKPYKQYTEKEWPKTKTSGEASFDIALMLVKDMLEDIDTTPEGNYDPIVVLISSSEVSPDYEDELEKFKSDGRFKNVQKIGIADLRSYVSFYNENAYIFRKLEPKDVVKEHVPKILRKFAKEKVAVFISDEWNTSWCTLSDWDRIETKYEYTHFCPVLSMMELRYMESNQLCTRLVCENAYDGSKGTDCGHFIELMEQDGRD